MAKVFTIFALMVIIFFKSARVLYSFDYGVNMPNITTVLLDDVGDCNIEPPKLNITKKYVQFFRKNDFGLNHVSICAVKVTRTVTNCGNIASYEARVIQI